MIAGIDFFNKPLMAVGIEMNKRISAVWEAEAGQAVFSARNHSKDDMQGGVQCAAMAYHQVISRILTQ